jgi:hypothetical protein
MSELQTAFSGTHQHTQEPKEMVQCDMQKRRELQDTFAENMIV